MAEKSGFREETKNIFHAKEEHKLIHYYVAELITSRSARREWLETSSGDITLRNERECK
jgi:hypothetical protein